jgi:hypothetical protein
MEGLPPPPSGSPAGSFRPHGRCMLLATDISGYGQRHDDEVQRDIRAQHYRILHTCLQESGIQFAECYHEDRGDGAIIVIPDRYTKLSIIHPFLDRLTIRLREYNLDVGKGNRIRLRVALHIGAASLDDHGLVGDDVNHVFRLIDAPRFKGRFSESDASVAFIASEDVYEFVIRPASMDIDPDAFDPIPVVVKETETTAWMQLKGKFPREPDGDGEVSDVCPYPGLAYFKLEHAQWFFGRDRATRDLLDRLREQLNKSEPLIVIGASGVGKSSLLRAGLMHNLKVGKLGVHGSKNWKDCCSPPPPNR